MAILKFRQKSQPAQLRCTGCSRTIDAPCDCGKPFAYIPAGKAAVTAVAAHPEKSSRALEADTGISYKTFERVRKKSTGTFVPVDKRTGLDGKVRRMPTHKPKQRRLLKTEIGDSMKAEVNRLLGDISAIHEQVAAVAESFKAISKKHSFASTEKKAVKDTYLAKEAIANCCYTTCEILSKIAQQVEEE